MWLKKRRALKYLEASQPLMKNTVQMSRRGAPPRPSRFRETAYSPRSAHKGKYRELRQSMILQPSEPLGNISPLSESLGCWGSSTQVRTFSPVSGSTSVWKVRRGCDWFSDIHRAFSGNMVSVIGKCVSLARHRGGMRREWPLSGLLLFWTTANTMC